MYRPSSAALFDQDDGTVIVSPFDSTVPEELMEAEVLDASEAGELATEPDELDPQAVKARANAAQHTKANRLLAIGFLNTAITFSYLDFCQSITRSA